MTARPPSAIDVTGWKKHRGSRDTHGTHGTHGSHNETNLTTNPDPPTHTQDHATTRQSRPNPRPSAEDSEEAAPAAIYPCDQPDPAPSRSQSASPRLLKGGRRNEGTRR